MAGRKGSIIALGGAVAVAAVAFTPAIGTVDTLLKLRADNPVSLDRLGSISSFTPSTQDENLAEVYARAVLKHSGQSFRFTPTSGSMNGRRSITVLVRADRDNGDVADKNGMALRPLAFNLDASRGWRKFALPESMGRKPLDPVVGEIALPMADYSISEGKSRLRTNVQLEAKTNVGTAPKTLGAEQQYRVDVGSSYSLTRNLNVTAGVRYESPESRLNSITDPRQDDQAVYVGTVFKF